MEKLGYRVIFLVNLGLLTGLILNIIYFPIKLSTVLIFWYLSLALTEHIAGWFYAWKIYHWPIVPTWVSVLWGTLIIMITEMLAIGGTLIIYGLWDTMWFMVFIPAVALALPGFPMSHLQQRKWEKMQKKNADILEVLNGHE